jgi:hypothetical protein
MSDQPLVAAVFVVMPMPPPPFLISGPPATARMSSALSTCIAVGAGWADGGACWDRD